MRLDCGHCVVREWTRADKASLVEPLQGMHANTGHFGYWLGEPFWRRGITTAAVGKAAPYALEHFGLARLESPVFAWNAASMRVLEKCGFEREGVLRKSVLKDGELIDEVLYVLVSESR